MAVGNASLDLAVVTLAIRALKDELGLRLAIDRALQQQYLEGDVTVTDEATVAACRTVGVVVDDYRHAVDASPALCWLEAETIRETFVGSADPGPYDVLSKERATAVLQEERD